MFKMKIFFLVQAMLRNISFEFFDKFRTICYRPFFKKIGKGTRICAGVIFKYTQEIEIGANCYIGPYTMLIGLGGLKIGNDVLIGAGSKICTTYHNYRNINIPISQQGISFDPIEIQNNVWIGFDVKILQNTKIEQGCIIGAGTVLISGQNFPKNAVIVGTPAVIKQYRN